jgi:YD repeat-containing protein
MVVLCGVASTAGAESRADGSSPKLTLDAKQRIKSVSVNGETTMLEYHANGQLRRVSQADNSQLIYNYDAAHRLIGLSDHLGNRVDYILDSNGNRVDQRAVDPEHLLSKRIERTNALLASVGHAAARR